MSIAQTIPTRRYPSFGRCIYCLKPFHRAQLTDEHAVPLSLNGSWIIERAACEPCRAYSNKVYENLALQSDMIRVPRAIFSLDRRNAKKKPPLSFPPIFPAGTANLLKVGHLEQRRLGRDEYPQVFFMLVLPPPGQLTASYFPGCRPERKRFRTWVRSIGPDGCMDRASVSDGATLADGYDKTPILISADYSQGTVHGSLRQRLNLNAFALMVAKIAYCFAVAELGPEGFDGAEIRQLLTGERDDVFNFVGAPPDGTRLSPEFLHHLSFRERSGLLSVIVHLFSSYDAPAYEVVVGREIPSLLPVAGSTSTSTPGVINLWRSLLPAVHAARRPRILRRPARDCDADKMSLTRLRATLRGRSERRTVVARG